MIGNCFLSKRALKPLLSNRSLVSRIGLSILCLLYPMSNKVSLVAKLKLILSFNDQSHEKFLFKINNPETKYIFDIQKSIFEVNEAAYQRYSSLMKEIK